MAKLTVETIEKEVVVVKEAKEYLIRLTEEEAREIVLAKYKSSIMPTALKDSWFPEQNERFWKLSREIFAVLDGEFTID